MSRFQFCAALSTLVLSSLAFGDVAYNSFVQEEDPYGGMYSAAGVRSKSEFGFCFTSSTTGAISRLSLAANNSSAISDAIPFNLNLYACAKEGVLGELLATVPAASTGVFYGLAYREMTTVAIPQIKLKEGSSYWVVLSETQGQICWSNSVVNTGPRYLEGVYRPSAFSGGMKVETEAVPEPASLAGVAMGAALLCRNRKRRSA